MFVCVGDDEVWEDVEEEEGEGKGEGEGVPMESEEAGHEVRRHFFIYFNCYMSLV